jgi:hypothetical protein
MQGTQQATYTDNKKMTPEYPRQVIEEVEKATFKMQEEVKEAEAPADACYRRRPGEGGWGRCCLWAGP